MSHTVSEILDPIGVSGLLQTYWGRLAWHRPRPLAPHGVLAALSQASLPALLELTDEPVVTSHVSGSGRYVTAQVDPREALLAFDRGRSLYFHLADHTEAAAWFRGGFAEALGVDPARIIVSLFAVRAGSGTPWHFDGNENFTVHLAGVKRWQLGPGSIRRPLIRHFLSDPDFSDRLRTHLHTDMPGVPEEVDTFDLEAGGVLYHPRGWWHRTVAVDDALSMNVCVTPRTWGEELADQLRNRLVAEERWRADVHRDSRGELRERVASLREVLDAWEAELADPDGIDRSTAWSIREGPQGWRLRTVRADGAALEVALDGDRAVRLAGFLEGGAPLAPADRALLRRVGLVHDG